MMVYVNNFSEIKLTRKECSFSHDIKSYINSTKYLNEPCEIYKKYGTFPSGFLYMWGKSHIDFDKFELKANEELIRQNPIKKN